MSTTARLIAVMAGLAVLAVVARPVSADALPEPSSDYEAEALEVCEEGDLECVRSTLDTMQQLTRELAQPCDHSAIFAALYTVVTEHYYETVSTNPDFFMDPSFVNHEDGVFAYYYFWPYVNWHNDLQDAVPDAWRVAFEAADGQEVTAAGNLMLGINAHVVRDLPFVLARLGLGNKEDHDRVNEILREAYQPALTAIDDHLADSIDDANLEGTTLDDDVLFEVVASWREQAWRDAQALAGADTEATRRAVATEIEQKAHTQAIEFRQQYAYPPGDSQRQERNDYCAEHAWPPDWIND